ncbi:BMP family ABC transporter substrate-binding protein [Cellulosilyticum sp. I15G10I2]|uniref:BMP family ABC transporter substrate-binding protein n=1 Tax=Cellulosilyticum sp. I15G10I2 TaxID=1892843 RepID=UPI00085C553F|nr:BMP family ABC transporter substrate-binding protein [Cellulosilyticum sp. I15G10I2]
MKKSLLKFSALLMAGMLVLSGCGSTTKDEAAKPAETNNTAEAPKAAETDAATAVKVGFIYVGPTGDGGWSYAHDQGRLYLEEQLGVETIIKESVPESQEVEAVAASMIDQGCNVIFATSFGYMDYLEKMSKEYPDVKFFHCSGYKTTENMTAYFGRVYQARYLSGIVAGMKTETNKIGYVAAFPIPEVIRGINAFTLGAQSVNPDVKVQVTWTNTWYDPAKEKDAAIALLDSGADVIAQHQDTAGPQQAAEERGVWAVGYNSDMSMFAPKANLTSAVWNWGPYYVEAVQSVIDGTYQSESYWHGLEAGIVDISPLTENAPAGAQEKVDAAKAAILDGSLNPFAGPIKDQTGAVKVEEGNAMTDEEMLSFDWFVAGVEGEIK